MGRAFDIIRPRRAAAAKFSDKQNVPGKQPRGAFKLGGIFEFVILAAIVTVLTSYFGKAVKSTFQTSNVSQNGGLPTLTTENIQDNTTKNKDNGQAVAQAGNDQNAAVGTNSITKENAKIKILNGAGISSLASDTRDKITKAGFNVTSIGNAKNKYTSTYVYYKNGAKDVAQEIGKILADRNPKVQESTVAQENDVIVVMGSL